MTDHKAIPEMSVESKLLLQRLSKMEPGEMVTNKELGTIASCNVQKRGRGYLTTARDRALADYGIVTEAVRGVGIKRVASADLPDVGRHSLKKIRNASKKAGRKLSTMDTSVMTRDQVTSTLAHLSLFGVIGHCARNRQVKQLMPLLENSSNGLPIGKTLEAFTGKPKT